MRFASNTSKSDNQKRALWSIGAAVTALVAGLNYLGPSTATASQRVLGSLIIIVCAIPSFIYLSRREANIPFIPIWGAIYALYYAFPVFTIEDYSLRGYHLPEEAIVESLWIALVGAVLMLLVFYLTAKTVGKAIPRISIQLQSHQSKVAAVVLSIIGFSVAFIGNRESSNFDSIFNFISQWPLLSVGILYVLFLKGELNVLLKIYLWLVLVPLLLLKDLGTGFLAGPLRDVIGLFLLYWAVCRKVPTKAIILCVLIVLPFFALKREFRARTWAGEESANGAFQKGLSYLSLVGKELSGDTRDVYGTAIEESNRRTANLLILGVVVRATPVEIPYWEGETYSTLLTTLIPRFVWPDKPQKQVGQDFGHRYKLLDAHDTETSVNLPQLVEMYANFGWLGILVGMPLLGLIYRSIYEVLNHPKVGTGGWVIAVLIFTGLANIESDLSLVFGGILQATLAYAILLRLTARTAGTTGIQEGFATVRRFP